MANESRFLNKQVLNIDGIMPDPSVGVVREGAHMTSLGGHQIGTSGNAMVQIISTLVQSQDFAQIEPAGSTGAKAIDMALAGVTPGDLCFAAPTQSVPDGIVWSATCYSAGVVNVRALHTQSGNINLASTHFRVMAIRFE